MDGNLSSQRLQPCLKRIDFTTSESITMGLLHSVISILSIFGNSFVLMAIYYTPKLRVFSNYFLASLALSDLMVGLLLNPMWTARAVIQAWQVNHPLTLAVSFLTVVSTIATTLNLCGVTIERYLAVTRVFEYTTIVTEKRSGYVIAAIWGVSFFAGTPRFFIDDIFMLSEFTTYTSLAVISFTLIISAYCYVHIVRAALTQSRRIARQTTVENQSKEILNRKTAVTVCIVVGVFVLLYAPQLAVSLIKVVIPSQCKKLIMMKVWFWCLIIAYFNSCCNPWIYAARSTEFRKAFKRFLPFKLKSNRITVITCKYEADKNSPPGPTSPRQVTRSNP